jgi:phosphate transport system protein
MRFAYQRQIEGNAQAGTNREGISMQSVHTVSAYDEELKFLSKRIAAIGGHAERMVEQAVAALVNADHGLARKVIQDDLVLDEGQREIDDKAIVIIARRQPMATDLREIVGAIRISADIERVGDLGKNVAKRVASVDGRQPNSLFRGLEALANLALTQLKEVLDVYASRSVEMIGFVRDRDDQIDAMYTSLFRELLTYMMEDPRNITPCTHLLFCAKNIERIGDHATNIAETIYYIVTGDQMSPERPKGDKTDKVVLPGMVSAK